MNERDLKSLLNRAAAALETPADLTDEERRHLVEDLCTEARGSDNPAPLPQIVNVKFCAPGPLAHDLSRSLHMLVAGIPTVTALEVTDVERIGDSTRTTPDPLTLAYVAIGAKEALQADAAVANPRYNPDDWNGETGFIEAVTNGALLLDQLADPVTEAGDWTVVFCYEVAEEFGLAYANALLDDSDADPRPIAERLIAEGQK